MLRFVLAAGLACLFGSAAAQPSFPCSGRLNPTERAICRDAAVADLDVSLDATFRQRLSELSAQGQADLWSVEHAWLRWRDTCGADTSCIGRRYIDRIEELAGVPPSSGATAPAVGPAPMAATPGDAGTPPDDIVERHVRNGRLEFTHADGLVTWSDIGGPCRGVINPDGTESSTCPVIGAVDSGLPPLPGLVSFWGEGLEQRLLGVVDTLLPDEDEAEYRSLFEGKNFYERVDDHVAVIRALVGE